MCVRACVRACMHACAYVRAHERALSRGLQGAKMGATRSARSEDGGYQLRDSYHLHRGLLVLRRQLHLKRVAEFMVLAETRRGVTVANWTGHGYRHFLASQIIRGSGRIGWAGPVSASLERARIYEVILCGRRLRVHCLAHQARRVPPHGIEALAPI